MTTSTKLILIKSLHTAIWIFYNVVIFYWLYAVVANEIDEKLWICIALVGVEVAVLLIFKNVCPVTIWARKLSDSQKANFDIFLPHWVAKYNKEIYGLIVAICLLLLVVRLVQHN